MVSFKYLFNLVSWLQYRIQVIEMVPINMQHIIWLLLLKLGFPSGSVVKNLPTNANLIPGSGRSSGQRKWQYTPIFLPGKSHGERAMAGYNPRGHERAGHDLATKQQQWQCMHIYPYFSFAFKNGIPKLWRTAFLLMVTKRF